jgi:hypothetical protein
MAGSSKPPVQIPLFLIAHIESSLFVVWQRLTVVSQLEAASSRSPIFVCKSECFCILRDETKRITPVSISVTIFNANFSHRKP